MSSTGGAKEQVARLLTLVPLLHARGSVRLDEAAALLGVRPQQLVRDLKVLLMVGLPGGYPDDLIDVDLDALDAEGVIRVSNADYLARPLRLSPTEAAAIVVALRVMRDGAGDETREVVDRALAKLETAAGGVPLIDPGQAPADLDRLAARLDDAASRGMQVRLDYYVPSRDERSERIVDPRGVVAREGVAYLDAWCHSAEAPRLFRLDRIERASVLDTPVSTAPEAPRDLGDGMFAQSDDVTAVTLVLDPPAHWVVEYYAVESVRRQGGELEVTMLVADAQWLVRLLMRLTPYARVVAPAAYAAEFTEASHRTLAMYDG